jgi:hypothetical protein
MFSKEAEMMESRILDVFVTLLVLVKKINGINTAGHINDFFVVIWKFLGFHRHRFSALHGGELCGYLLLSSLLQQSITVGYRSNPMFKIGGELNDFNE